jgi:hypothetical protein
MPKISDRATADRLVTTWILRHRAVAVLGVQPERAGKGARYA